MLSGTEFIQVFALLLLDGHLQHPAWNGDPVSGFFLVPGGGHAGAGTAIALIACLAAVCAPSCMFLTTA